MATIEKENGDVIGITCKRCAAQSRFNLKELKGDEPLTCRECGAPLEERRKGKKAMRGSRRLIDDPVWGAYWRERRTDYVEWVAKAIALIIFIGIILLCIILNVSRFIYE
jgi:hypothetical protein